MTNYMFIHYFYDADSTIYECTHEIHWENGFSLLQLLNLLYVYIFFLLVMMIYKRVIRGEWQIKDFNVGITRYKNTTAGQNEAD